MCPWWSLQDCGDLQFAIFMCDCSLHLGDRFLRKVSSSLSFEHDVRTFFWGGTIQEAGAERERERESQMGRIRRPTRTRLIITVRKNQMVLQRHNQVNVCIWLWWWFPLQCFGRRYLSISIYLSVIISIYLSGFGYDDVFKSSSFSNLLWDRVWQGEKRERGGAERHGVRAIFWYIPDTRMLLQLVSTQYLYTAYLNIGVY